MRCRAVVSVVVVLAASACSSAPEKRTAAGVPERWYTQVREELAKQPNVGSMAILDNGGRCLLRDDVVLNGKKVSHVSDHGVVRLGGDVPAVVCEWYEDTPVQVVVAQAADADRYADVVAGTGAEKELGNTQTEREVVVRGRTFRVVRTDYPTNPAAGTSYTAALLDDASRGRVTLKVDSAHEIAGYDEQKAAADLAAFLDG